MPPSLQPEPQPLDTAKNSSDETRTATLTITWLDPTLDFSVTKDTNAATTKVGDAINVAYTTLDGGSFEVTVTGPIGSTISYDAISATSWLGVNPGKSIRNLQMPAMVQEKQLSALGMMSVPQLMQSFLLLLIR